MSCGREPALCGLQYPRRADPHATARMGSHRQGPGNEPAPACCGMWQVQQHCVRRERLGCIRGARSAMAMTRAENRPLWRSGPRLSEELPAGRAVEPRRRRGSTQPIEAPTLQRITAKGGCAGAWMMLRFCSDASSRGNSATRNIAPLRSGSLTLNNRLMPSTERADRRQITLSCEPPLGNLDRREPRHRIFIAGRNGRAYRGDVRQDAVLRIRHEVLQATRGGARTCDATEIGCDAADRAFAPR